MIWNVRTQNNGIKGNMVINRESISGLPEINYKIKDQLKKISKKKIIKYNFKKLREGENKSWIYIFSGGNK